MTHRCDLCGKLILFGLVGLIDHYSFKHPSTKVRDFQKRPKPPEGVAA